MIQVKATVKGDFAKRLAERREKWQGQKTLAARIRVGEDLKWWVYQEYGTASFKLKEPEAHADITPVNADKLAFTLDGKQIIVDSTKFPGIPPKRMIETLQESGSFGEALQILTREAFQAGAADDPSLLGQVAVQAAQIAKEQIVESFRTTFKNTSRENLSGRPEHAGSGMTAVEAFDSGAEVVDLSK